MKRVLVASQIVLAVTLFPAAVDALAREVGSLTDYQSRLRQEIADRARLLRDARTGQVDSTTGRITGTSLVNNSNTRTSNANRNANNAKDNPFGVDLKNPFGPGLDFAAQAWENARLGHYDLFLPPPKDGSGKNRNKKGGDNEYYSLDLDGQAMPSMRQARVAQPAAPVPPKKDTEQAKKDAEEAEKEAAERLTQAAELLFNNGEYGAARNLMLPVATAIRRPQEEIDAAKKFVERIDTLGMKRLTEADEVAANGDTDKAATLYDDITRKFGSAPAARLARHKLVILKENPEIASRFLFEKARSYADNQRLDLAIPLLREIGQRYAKTQCAAEAAALLAKLQSATTQGELPPDQVLIARRWLLIGDIHAANGRLDKAVQSYQIVTQDFEDSKYADLAQQRLAKLERQR